MGVSFDYFGARYYDSDISVWLSVDPMSDMYPSTSAFMYVRGNPVMLVDPDGMNEDDFYFDKDGNLIDYVENDQPDRVFVSTGEMKVDPDDPDMVPQPVYNQVEMSSEEIEQKMNANGYNKVVESQTVTETVMTTYYTDADGGNRETSRDITNVDVHSQEFMYVKKEQTHINKESTFIGNIDRKHRGTYMIEKNKMRYDYNYSATKNSKNERNKTIFKIALELIKEIITNL